MGWLQSYGFDLLGFFAGIPDFVEDPGAHDGGIAVRLGEILAVHFLELIALLLDLVPKARCVLLAP